MAALPLSVISNKSTSISTDNTLGYNVQTLSYEQYHTSEALARS